MASLQQAAQGVAMLDNVTANAARARAEASMQGALLELLREQRNTNVLLWAMLSEAQRESAGPLLEVATAAPEVEQKLSRREQRRAAR